MSWLLKTLTAVDACDNREKKIQIFTKLIQPYFHFYGYLENRSCVLLLTFYVAIETIETNLTHRYFKG